MDTILTTCVVLFALGKLKPVSSALSGRLAANHCSTISEKPKIPPMDGEVLINSRQVALKKLEYVLS